MPVRSDQQEICFYIHECKCCILPHGFTEPWSVAAFSLDVAPVGDAIHARQQDIIGEGLQCGEGDPFLSKRCAGGCCDGDEES